MSQLTHCTYREFHINMTKQKHTHKQQIPNLSCLLSKAKGVKHKIADRMCFVGEYSVCHLYFLYPIYLYFYSRKQNE